MVQNRNGDQNSTGSTAVSWAPCRSPRERRAPACPLSPRRHPPRRPRLVMCSVKHGRLVEYLVISCNWLGIGILLNLYIPFWGEIEQLFCFVGLGSKLPSPCRVDRLDLEAGCATSAQAKIGRRPSPGARARAFEVGETGLLSSSSCQHRRRCTIKADVTSSCWLLWTKFPKQLTIQYLYSL